MRTSELLSIAWDTLRSHRLRSFLALLGLVIGVATLITVMTIVQGANTYVEQKIANLGVRVFRVSKVPLIATNFEELLKALRYKDITVEELEAVRSACRNCEAVGAQVFPGSASARGGSGTGRIRFRDKEIADVAIVGQTANMSYISTRSLASGRFFTPYEDRSAAPVTLLGYGLVDRLFGGANALGQTVRFAGQDLRVIGTMEKIGSVLGRDQDNYVLIPLGTFLRLRGSHHSLTLEIRAGENLFQAAQDEVRLILRTWRHVLPGAKEDFYIWTPDSYLELWRSISGAFFLVFVMISSIAAVVGGIVIMNIMLVSVTERTKEIGVRRACGARQRDILRQFLAEAVLQCLIGGTVGVLLGFGAATLLRQLTSFPADVKAWVALLGLFFASAIGLFFGIYPAVKAAQLDPVVALRSEG